MKTEDKGVLIGENREDYHWFSPSEIQVVSNPRTYTNPGFKPEKMAELRGDIQRVGLKQALEIRIKDGKPTLIAGERRLRSVQTLIEEDTDVFDRSTGKFGKASRVYANVKCTLTVADDKEAARAAVAENMLHEHLTDYEFLLLCGQLEDSGHSRAEQSKFFDKSEAWVSQSHSLLKGNPKVLDALHEGTLGRTQALQFLNYPPEKADAILARSIAYNKMDFEEKERELLDHREKVFERHEEHEAQMRAAEESGDNEEAMTLRKKMREDEKEADATDRKLKKHRTSSKRKPRPSINNIQTAAQAEAADGGAQRHIPMKNVKRMADQLAALLDGGESLMNPETETEYNRREVKIVRDVLNFVLSRNGLKSPLDALNVEDDDCLVVAAK